jgi:hypothetical protein
MKKVDSATGMTIEVPEDMNVRAKFPYPGFWAAANPNLVRSVQQNVLPNENMSVVSNGMNALVDLANGEHAVILTERIWYIGELMNKNSELAIQGRAGSALGYIQENRDGGRMAVAARIFDKPLRALIQQGMSVTQSQNAMSNLLNEQTHHKNNLERLARQLDTIEKSVWTPTELKEYQRTGADFESKLVHAQNEYNELTLRIAELEKFRTHFSTVKKQYESEVSEIRRLQSQIQTSQTRGNAAEQVSRILAPIMKRAKATGVWLSKAAASADMKVLNDMKALLQIRAREVNQLETEVAKYQATYTKEAQAYENAVAEGRGVWQEITQITNHLNSMSSNITNAQNAMSTFSNVEASQLTRIWVEHLTNCRRELEQLLFESKANAMGAVTGSPRALMADNLVQPGTLKDYEDFVDALDMIGDALENEEYDLMEEIGRLGLAMGYVPGGSRVLALSELRKSNRVVAYRNLIEEILSQGQKISEEAKRELGIGPFVFESDSDLVEVKELLRHLTDSKLNFKYGGEM